MRSRVSIRAESRHRPNGSSRPRATRPAARSSCLSFPDYETAIGAEIGRALHGERDYAADVMQLLYIANRYEYRPQIELWLEQGLIVICDRYLASSIAYGEAQGLDPEWLTAHSDATCRSPR